eukprot:Gregarina_sp_Poly_1__5302@NODE_2801_length_1702_cov_69_004281_g1764_i0_p1_GENE_NODE_2801_length_1702_cov_69_004281_g1764_i0NODE_2801_length_1702_cov_69_004281_g1764_i0_p1_ORF_typecomplete_len385_score40_92DnaJ/PF00226_31/0_026DNA_pol3_gamma3/PF12169_8/0_16_NODE_2801_length_1702_cov_69_004281_g1764_i0491203
MAAIAWLNTYGSQQRLLSEGPFQALGVEPSRCTEQLLNRIKKTLLLLVHPDKLCLDGLQDDERTQLTISANSAFRILNECVSQAQRQLLTSSQRVYGRAPFADDCGIPDAHAPNPSPIRTSNHSHLSSSKAAGSSWQASPPKKKQSPSTKRCSPSNNSEGVSPPANNKVKSPTESRVWESLQHFKLENVYTTSFAGDVSSLKLASLVFERRHIRLLVSRRHSLHELRYIRIFLCYPFPCSESAKIADLLAAHSRTQHPSLLSRLAGVFRFEGLCEQDSYLKLQPVPIITVDSAVYHLGIQEFTCSGITPVQWFCFGLATPVSLQKLTKDELVEQLRFFSTTLKSVYQSSFQQKDFADSSLRSLTKSSLVSLAKNLFNDIKEHAQ